MHKVCAKIVPKRLTPEQKELKMIPWAEILKNTSNDLKLLDRVITCNRCIERAETHNCKKTKMNKI